MNDLGGPTSHLELADGVPVLGADGQAIGTVEHVLADAHADLFDGIVFDSRLDPGADPDETTPDAPGDELKRARAWISGDP